MSNILVTGSEGSLMREVIPKLIDKGHFVVGVDNLFKGTKPSLVKKYSQKDYVFIQGDLADPSIADYACGLYPIDSIIQAAARIYGVGGFHKNAADILGQDISVHNSVLEAAKTKNIKHVTYISSSMVYEGFDNLLREDQELKLPSTDYGLSKVVGERLSKAYNLQYDIDYTIWRPFNIITPHESSEKDDIGTSHVFADFIKHIVTEKRDVIPLIGDGSQIRCFTWIDEVASVIANFQGDEKTKNEVFNLGNREPISMKELATIIKEEALEIGLIESKELSFNSVMSFKDDVMVRIPDVSKAEEKLGWKTNISTRDSVRKCLEKLS